uniref:Transthyretin-like family protein n=1 Tax=Panagrellus redivivus TaxID=6233 RepID=A0A7E4VFA1_PANRE
MFRIEVLVSLLFGLFTLTSGWGRPLQSSGAYGTLTCNGKPAKNVLVKLYDHDTFTTDDKMAETKTNLTGFFEISGKAREFTTINPELNIYHDCNDGIKPCLRVITLKINSSYVNFGEEAKNLYPVGTLELAVKYPGEKRECI